MKPFPRNPFIATTMLPVDIVLAPAWWHRHGGITFDRDFYFHPLRRVEAERQMERVLYEKWGRYGLGDQRDQDRPELGAVHLAAGYLLQEMLGCQVSYPEDAPPQVIPAEYQALTVNQEGALASAAWRDLLALMDQLKARCGRVVGDVNWSGVLNLALDLRGQRLFMDRHDQPVALLGFYHDLAAVIERFVMAIQGETGSSSISVNRTVRHIQQPVFLHSECSHTMISVADYRSSLMAIDAAWSQRHRPFGIHYCGQDPHRFAEAYADLPHLDFLDVGWGGDVALLRQHLPTTFLNLRLSPVELIEASEDEIASTIRRLVQASGNPWLTGVCCINMDDRVGDSKIDAIYRAVEELRLEYASRV
jgi:hypothetical protein